MTNWLAPSSIANYVVIILGSLGITDPNINSSVQAVIAGVIGVVTLWHIWQAHVTQRHATATAGTVAVAKASTPNIEQIAKSLLDVVGSSLAAAGAQVQIVKEAPSATVPTSTAPQTYAIPPVVPGG